MLPSGAPIYLAPLLVLIESVSYVSRAVSLGIRIAANLTAGHLLVAIVAGFATVTSNPLILPFPTIILVAIVLLELAVAVIQAYVFCLLVVIYLADVTS